MLVLTFAEVLLFPGGRHAVLLARQLDGRSCFSAECSVCDLSLQGAVILIQLLLQNNVCCWLCLVGQPAMRLKVLEDEKAVPFLCFCRMTQQGR